MSDLAISATEHGKLRVFALDDKLAMELDSSGVLDRLEQALGSYALGKQDVQIVQTRAIGDIGLSGLLIDGYDVALSPKDAAQLDAVDGTVALIRSAAFTGAVTLTPNDEVTLVATYTEGKAPAPHFTPLESDAAMGVLEGPTPDVKPKRGFGARLALIAFAAMVAAIACLYFYYTGF